LLFDPYLNKICFGFYAVTKTGGDGITSPYEKAAAIPLNYINAYLAFDLNRYHL